MYAYVYKRERDSLYIHDYIYGGNLLCCPCLRRPPSASCGRRPSVPRTGAVAAGGPCDVCRPMQGPGGMGAGGFMANTAPGHTTWPGLTAICTLDRHGCVRNDTDMHDIVTLEYSSITALRMLLVNGPVVTACSGTSTTRGTGSC
jgi:hypothetical protein